MSQRILIVEDEDKLRRVLSLHLQGEGYEVDEARTAEEAMPLADRAALVLTDLRLPTLDGLTLMERLRLTTPATPVVVMTAYGSVEVAVEAMKRGAADFLPKPFSLDHLMTVVRKVMEVKTLREENVRLKEELGHRYAFDNIIGRGARMREILGSVERVAPTRTTVLLCGESGVGKDLIARAIHFHSPRARHPFVKINCTAIPENLMESELFGYEKGAFTGAAQAKPGKFEQADTGTVFLDEIGDVPPSIQVKLLRVLEERRVLPVGAVTPVAIDVRFVFATNRDLEAEVARGAFRSDLFYRINGIAVTIPPLRERPSEIEELARKFAADGAARDEVAVPEFSPQAIAALKTWPWPGNIRELKNAVDRALLMAPDGTITPAALGLEPASSPGRPAVGRPEAAPSEGAPNLKSKRAEAEKKAVLEALELTEGNRTRAARVLGISRRTLVSRLQEYGINKPRQGSDEPGSGEQGA